MSQKMSKLQQEAKSLAVDKRKKKLRSQQMTALKSGCRSSTWRWDSSCGKSAVTRTLIGKSGMRTTTTECAALLDSDILIKRITQSISILVHTNENKNPKKKVGVEEVLLYWWLITSPYGSSEKKCALENLARVQIGTVPQRTSSKTKSARW